MTPKTNSLTRELVEIAVSATEDRYSDALGHLIKVRAKHAPQSGVVFLRDDLSNKLSNNRIDRAEEVLYGIMGENLATYLGRVTKQAESEDLRSSIKYLTNARVIFLIDDCHETRRGKFKTEIDKAVKQVFQIANSGLEKILGATASLAEEIKDTKGQFKQITYNLAKEEIAHARKYANSGSKGLDEHLVKKINKAEIELHKIAIKKLRLLASGYALRGDIVDSIAHLSEIMGIKREADKVYKNGAATEELRVESILTTAYEKGTNRLLEAAQNCYRENPKQARKLLADVAYYTSRKFLKETGKKLFPKDGPRLEFADEFYLQIDKIREAIKKIGEDVKVYEKIRAKPIVVTQPKEAVVAGSKHKPTIVSWGNFGGKGNN